MLYGRAVEDNGEWLVEGVDLTVEYDRAMAAIDPIPDKKVAALKALDNRKRAVFALIDERPGIPACQAKLIVVYRSMTTRSVHPDAFKTTNGDKLEPVDTNDTEDVTLAPDPAPPEETGP